MLAVVAPGQGSQTPGLLTAWLTTGEPAARQAAADALGWYSAVTGMDLTDLGTHADEETIRDTAVAQPLLVATGLVAAGALAVALDLTSAHAEPTSAGSAPAGGTPGLPADVLAGHSVGELTAAALSGALSAEQALVLVERRGAGMAAAAAARRGGMTAVLGGDPDEVLAVLARLGLTAANTNGGGQVVAAGDLDALAALAADPPARARLRPLAVAGAFHTGHMAPAVESLRRVSRGLRAAEAAVPVVSNRDGSVVRDGSDLLGRIIDQVGRPVRWDACQRTLADLRVTGLLELAPAGTLTGLARRGLPGVATFALRTPADLEGAVDFVATHLDGAGRPRPGDRAGTGTAAYATALHPGPSSAPPARAVTLQSPRSRGVS